MRINKKQDHLVNDLLDVKGRPSYRVGRSNRPDQTLHTHPRISPPAGFPMTFAY